MLLIGVISGSGFYEFPGLENAEVKVVDTKFGRAEFKIGMLHGKPVAFIARHGTKHERLPNMINHQATIAGLQNLGVSAIIGTTVCGVLKSNIPLAQLTVFDDLYFPENRLPNGKICTMYDMESDPKRGHLIFGQPFNEALRQMILTKHPQARSQATYVYANGPRFNSKAEIRMMQQYGDFVSQTAGPEAMLAAELEIPYVLLGFGIDYANGVSETPTPMDVLNANLKKSSQVFVEAIGNAVKNFTNASFDGFVYRFE